MEEVRRLRGDLSSWRRFVGQKTPPTHAFTEQERFIKIHDFTHEGSYESSFFQFCAKAYLHSIPKIPWHSEYILFLKEAEFTSKKRSHVRSKLLTPCTKLVQSSARMQTILTRTSKISRRNSVQPHQMRTAKTPDAEFILVDKQVMTWSDFETWSDLKI